MEEETFAAKGRANLPPTPSAVFGSFPKETIYILYTGLYLTIEFIIFLKGCPHLYSIKN